MLFNLYYLLLLEHRQYDKMQIKCEKEIKNINMEIIESKSREAI